MEKLSDLRLSKNMKYTALYWAMRFFEHAPDIFEKEYAQGIKIFINSNSQEVLINGKCYLILNTHESFVELECINRLLELGCSLDDFAINSNYLNFKNYKIKFIAWDDSFDLSERGFSVLYKSRLVSGVLEYQSKIFNDEKWHDYGLFEKNTDTVILTNKIHNNYMEHDYIFDKNRVMKYCGKDKVVRVPDGVEELESSSFWDNQYIEEVILPDSLVNMGGDTFYNCQNLRKINIPKNVKIIGNNPFAGCPLVEIANKSPYFLMQKGALYTKDMQTMIYCSIKGDEQTFEVPNTVKIISKHAFYLCDRLAKIILPKSLKKMENNPFSGCSKLEIDNHSQAYFIKDDVIYNGYKTSVVGTLNKIKSDRLVLLEGIKTINRNSFWNCTGIKSIVFPKSLEDIGYNPFVGCSNIHFESHTPYYKVIDGVLYNKDCSKIVCYPAWKAVGDISILDSVIKLERGAFSGCKQMTSIALHNVNVISKSCFTNCSSLKELYVSDFITYIGEWAFAYCSSLRCVSVYKDTAIDNNAFSNCPVKLEIRNEYSNYLVESENSHTLRSMAKRYKGEIDSILIDPPYNSHIDYIGYNDGNYDDYSDFILARIRASYQLLSEKGFLVINIDEGEVSLLSKLSQEVFGDAHVKVYRWKKKHDFFDANRVVLNPNKIQTDYEYIIICKKEKAIFGKLMQPYIEKGVLKERKTEVPDTFDCFGTTSSAKDEIAFIFGDRAYFSTPKPVKLMKELIRATTNKNSLIMDYFAGSGTLGQACSELNAEDGGNRKFILVSNSESDICNKVAKKRLDYIGLRYAFLK